jgi:hypothetical protein
MQAIKSILALTLSVLTSNVFATIVPITNEVLEASLKSEARDHYVDGYVQLNKTKGTISLLLQPVMPPCPVGHSCPEVMPAPQDYFLEEVKVVKDECDAVIYQAEQTQEHSIRVRLVDNTQYNYGNCPTFLPVPETVVEVEQIFYGPNSTEEKAEYFAAEALSPIRY